MSNTPTLADRMRHVGISRREFLGFCATAAAAFGLDAAGAAQIARALERRRRPAVIWLSFQECTGCTESLTRAHAPTLEALLFQHLSLDYHHTLQAAAGDAAEAAREATQHAEYGKYLLAVDGSIPLKDGGIYSTIAGRTNLDLLTEAAAGAAAIIAIGTCASYGGLPAAQPNPTGAAGVAAIIKDKPIINVPGCPPIPDVMTGILAHYLTFGAIPELDDLGRPRAFYGERIHDRCYRRPFYDKGLFAKTFDDEGARKGWCLYLLGCKGPTTYNACATAKWNEGTSFPIEAGHGCLGCSQPGFWDHGSFYKALSSPTEPAGSVAVGALAAGAVAGAAIGLGSRARRAAAKSAHVPVTVDELEKPS